MPLEQITPGAGSRRLSDKMQHLLEEAEERITVFQEGIGEQASPLFEPADYAEVASALLWIQETLKPGQRFCEWGCGFGVVTALASVMGFEAVGIENDALLLDQARSLYTACDIQAELVTADLFNLSPDEDRSIGPATFDLIYSYPWPRETDKWVSYFEDNALPGALLLTFHDFGQLDVHRKVGAAR